MHSLRHLLGEVFISAQPGLALLLLAFGIGVHPVQLCRNAALQAGLLPLLCLLKHLTDNCFLSFHKVEGRSGKKRVQTEVPARHMY